MFLQRIADIGLLEPDRNSRVLKAWDLGPQRKICSEVLRFLADPKHAASVAAIEAHARWSMEAVSQALCLPIESPEDADTLELAVDLYVAWLQDATKPAIAGSTSALVPEVIRQCSLVFEERRVQANPSVSRRYVKQCRRLIGTFEAIAQLGDRLCRETWTLLLKVVLGVADIALCDRGGSCRFRDLGDPYESSTEIVACHLQEELLRVLFLVFLLCPETAHGGSDIASWVVFRDFVRSNWLENQVLTPQWTAMALCLSDRLARLLANRDDDLSEADHLGIWLHWPASSSASFSVLSLPRSQVITNWYRAVSLLGRPSRIHDPSSRKVYLDGLAQLSDYWLRGRARALGVRGWTALIGRWLLDAATDEEYTNAHDTAAGLDKPHREDRESSRGLALTTVCKLFAAAGAGLSGERFAELCRCLEQILDPSPSRSGRGGGRGSGPLLVDSALWGATALLKRAPAHALHLVPAVARCALAVLLDATSPDGLRLSGVDALRTLAIAPLPAEPAMEQRVAALWLSSASCTGAETTIQLLLRASANAEAGSGAVQFCWLVVAAALLRSEACLTCDAAEGLAALAAPGLVREEGDVVTATALDALAALRAVLPCCSRCPGSRMRLAGVLAAVCQAGGFFLSTTAIGAALPLGASSAVRLALGWASAAPWLLRQPPCARALLSLLCGSLCSRGGELPLRSSSEPNVGGGSVVGAGCMAGAGVPTMPRAGSDHWSLMQRAGDGCSGFDERAALDTAWQLTADQLGLCHSLVEGSMMHVAIVDESVFGSVSRARPLWRHFALREPSADGHSLEVTGVASVLDLASCTIGGRDDEESGVLLVLRRAAGKFVWRFRPAASPVCSSAASASNDERSHEPVTVKPVGPNEKAKVAKAGIAVVEKAAEVVAVALIGELGEDAQPVFSSSSFSSPSSSSSSSSSSFSSS